MAEQTDEDRPAGVSRRGFLKVGAAAVAADGLLASGGGAGRAADGTAPAGGGPVVPGRCR